MRPTKSPSIKKRKAWVVFTIHAALVILSLVFLSPLIWMILTALKPLDETMKSPPQWIPSQFQWGNFGEAFG